MGPRLAWAYARHALRRRFRPSPPASAEEVVTAFAEDRLRPLSTEERVRLPAMSRCVSCGLCALVVRRLGHVRPPDLANAYLRDLTLLPPAVADLPGGAEARRHALEAAAAVCPVGVPLDEVAAAVRRLAGAEPDQPVRALART
ncbi:MAG TPA: hypothetical protein VOB72_01205 [Candidatus Dormibacteraeota bacterium]|nr:hypothetical protein [Candidatus Dormibacteraeota bacterium]